MPPNSAGIQRHGRFLVHARASDLPCFLAAVALLVVRRYSMKQCSYCGAKYPDGAIICATDGTTLDEPQKQSQSGSFKIERLWTPYLVLCSIISVFSVLSYLSHWQRMNATLPTWALMIFRFIAFLRPLCIVAMWWGSRSGVVAHISLSVAAASVWFALTPYITVRLGIIFGLIIHIVIITALVRPRWQQMVWEVQMPVNEKDDH